MNLSIAKHLFIAVILGWSLQVGASTVSDPAADYLAGYSGSMAGDLDVTSALVTYNPATDIFHFESTFAGSIGGSPSGFYIWGFDRGAGAGRFEADGLPNVLFDAVVRFNFDGSGAVNLLAPTASSTSFGKGTAVIQGNQLVADLAGDLLPSSADGVAKTAYTWNLWPRDGALPAGFGQISDFAPDTNNAAVQVVPLPAAFWLFGTMVGFAFFNGTQRMGCGRH